MLTEPDSKFFVQTSNHIVKHIKALLCNPNPIHEKFYVLRAAEGEEKMTIFIGFVQKRF